MTMNNDGQFEEELTCHFKIDMRNLILTQALESLVILMCSL